MAGTALPPTGLNSGVGGLAGRLSQGRGKPPPACLLGSQTPRASRSSSAQTQGQTGWWGARGWDAPAAAEASTDWERQGPEGALRARGPVHGEGTLAFPFLKTFLG